ncbi:MAG TPA: phosphonate ABC transporter, permease protein PhnE [Burkholderiaceae bacterium]|nr:phosphonate ABC transporter, permease protein PhnE [Burkholderiaceae bacterium]
MAGRLAWMRLAAAGYALLLLASVWSLAAQGDLNLGRRPLANLQRTLAELSHPSFLDLGWGPQRLEYRADDGRLLRVEDRRQVEARYLQEVLRATWTTLKIGTLGAFMAALAALPLGFAAARNVRAPGWLARPVRALLDLTRAIHTLVWGLIYVGIVGLGPVAGILAIASHSLGSYGKLYAEAIEAADAGQMESGLALGLRPWQVLLFALRRSFYPQFAATHLYLWEFNVRDSTVLGLIGAGGLGLLVSEAVSLFQWDRLATLLVVIVALVVALDRGGAWLRRRLQEGVH